MGSITSGTGLVSGLDIESIIGQLMQIEARPRQQVEERVEGLEEQKEALLDINSSVMGIREASDAMAQPSAFNTKQAESSNEEVLTADASRSAPEGTYRFIVDQLVSSHQMISQGFANADSGGFDSGTLSFSPEAARLSHDVQLTSLNGGDGVPRGRIEITDRSGASAEVDLSRAATVDDVLRAINSAGGVGVRASLDGDGIRLTDTTGQTAENLSVSEVSGGSTAAGLGLLGHSDGADAMTGSAINHLSGSSQLARLNDRNGIGILGNDRSDLRIDLGGQAFDVSLDGAENLDDVMARINDHADNPGVTAAIGDDGVSLELSGNGAIEVTALNGSSAAEDLGILGSGQDTLEGDRLVAALNSRLLSNLNGGDGIDTPGSIEITNRSGQTTAVDLTNARSVSDVIGAINDAGAGVSASLNQAGNGLLIEDTTGGNDPLTIADVDGTIAADMNLATDGGGVNEATLDTGSLEYRYVSEGTQLADLNGGEGVSEGSFTITDSQGAQAVISVNENRHTLRDVIADINARSLSVEASINERGDGLLLTDTADGALSLTVEEQGGTTAAELGILGEAAEGESTLEGSFRQTVDVEQGDTLSDVAQKINDLDGFVSASVINDGSEENPYRLTLTSERGGVDGQMVFDDGGLGLKTGTLSRGRDAVAFYGADDPADAVMLTSRNNSLDDVVPGVSIDLHNASEGPVSVTVSRNDEDVTEKVESFVSAFNKTIELFGEYDYYDQEEEERGVLLGDPTVAQVRRRLYNMVHAKVDGVEGQFDHMTQVGIRVGEDGLLEFDSDRLQEALNTDAEAVKQLFTASEKVTPEQPDDLPPGVSLPEQPTTLEPVGFARQMAKLGEELSSSVDGIITMRARNIDSDVALANDRIEQLNQMLVSKRQQLEQEFTAMERALADMQSQQDSLNQLAQAAQGPQ